MKNRFKKEYVIITIGAAIALIGLSGAIFKDKHPLFDTISTRLIDKDIEAPDSELENLIKEYSNSKDFNISEHNIVIKNLPENDKKAVEGVSQILNDIKSGKAYEDMIKLMQTEKNNFLNEKLIQFEKASFGFSFLGLILGLIGIFALRKRVSH